MSAEKDPSGSGRTSRASTMSTLTRATGHHPYKTSKNDPLSRPGVTSMLRTTTEMGNVVESSGHFSGTGSVPSTSRRRVLSSRLSVASSLSNASSQASRQHRTRPSSSMTPAFSTREPQFVSNTDSSDMFDMPRSSPLTPRERENNSDRSLSMTNKTGPALRLSSNRSLGSLQRDPAQQWPRSPYVYPTRLRRPSYRPVSPALSDITNSHSRRLFSYGNQGTPHFPCATRSNTPSDTSLAHRERQDRVHGRPRLPMRVPSPTYHPNSYTDMQQMHHAYPHHMVVEQARLLSPSTRGSLSSGSTNLRTDSDQPSSDTLLPPTPGDGVSVEVLVNSEATEVKTDITGTKEKKQFPRSHTYYDYSEPFHVGQLGESGTSAVRAGFLSQIKTIAEEIPLDEASLQHLDIPSPEPTNELKTSAISKIIEPPATTITRSATRDLTQEVTRPASAMGDVAPSEGPMFRKSKDQIESTGVKANPTDDITSIRAGDYTQNCHDDQSCIVPTVNPRELDFSATRREASNSIPIATRVSLGTQIIVHHDAADPTDPGKSTEDDACIALTRDVEGDVVAGAPSVKIPDAHSTPTANQVTVADRDKYMPRLGSLPSGGIERVIQHQSSSEVGPQNPPSVVIMRNPSPPTELEFSAMIHSLQTIPRSRIKKDTVSVSGSSSASTVAQQRSVVSHRDHSSWKEAQSFRTVPSLLVRQLPAALRKFKAQMFGENLLLEKEEPSAQHLGLSQESSGKDAFIPQEIRVAIEAPEKAIIKQDVLTERPSRSSLARETVSRTSDSSASITSPTTHEIFSCNDKPPLVLNSTSTLLFKPSPDLRSVQSVHAGKPVSVLDSQTTTQLACPSNDPKGSTPPLASISNALLSEALDGITADSRMSKIEYGVPLRHLPDLKEESHEDSSLNTSAGNLKHPSLGLPVGSLVCRASADDEMVYLRRWSARSQPRDTGEQALAQAKVLPSMEFSHTNLVEKLQEELGLRCSKSLENLKARSRGFGADSPPRPVSAGEVRERHQSRICDREKDRNPLLVNQVPRCDVESLQCVQMTNKLMAELEELTIPSVGGLTTRISELLPSLRTVPSGCDQYNFSQEEEVMENPLEEYRKVHPVQKRSSARLRPWPGSPHMMVFDDDVYRELTARPEQIKGRGDNGEQVTKSGAGEAGGKPDLKVTPIRQCLQRQFTPLAELEAPIATLPHPRLYSTSYSDIFSSRETGVFSARSTKQFLSTSTTTDARPWNADKNFPWVTAKIPSVDIALPSLGTVTTSSPRPGPSHLRNTLSSNSTSTTNTHSLSSTDTAAPSHPDAHPGNQARRHVRSHSLTTFGRSGDKPHPVGERYPTSALIPPTAIFRDFHTISDSSDDEDFYTTRKSRLRVIKRFASASNVTHERPLRVVRSKVHAEELALPQSTEQSIGSNDYRDQPPNVHVHTLHGAKKIKIINHHRRRLVNYIKKAWHKGQRLFRNLSQPRESDSIKA